MSKVRCKHRRSVVCNRRCESCRHFAPADPLPGVEECKQYIRECGWKFEYYNRPWYVFTLENFRIAFTLGELREAYTHGW